MNKISFDNIFRPEYIYIIFALFFGTLYLIIVPPLSFDDARVHSNKTMEIALGGFFTRKNIPESMDSTADLFGYRFNVMLTLDTEIGKAAGWKNDLPEKKAVLYEDDFIAKKLNEPLEKENTVDSTKVVGETMFYSPVPYLSQALGYFIGYHLNLSPLMLVYLGSTFTMLLCIGITFYALKKCPILKWQMLMVTLFPWAIFYNPTITADPFTNAISFLYFSLVVSYAMQKSPVTGKQIAALCITAFLICTSKSGYFPIAFIALLIPKNKFRDSKEFIKSMLIIILPPIAASLYFMYWSNKEYSYLIELLNWRNEGIDAAAQKAYILQEPAKFLILSLKTIPWEMIEKIFLLISMPVQELYTAQVLIFFFALIVAREKEGNFIDIKLWQRIMLFIICAIVISGTYLFMYLVGTEAYKDEIIGFRERYLIPLVPLILLATIATKPLKSPYPPLARKAGVILLSTSTFASLCLLLNAFSVRYYGHPL